MSRSYRKTPITGMTTKGSDKLFKTAAHKRARRAAKALDLADTDPPTEKKFGNQWTAPKDGKGWFDKARFPKLMRK